MKTTRERWIAAIFICLMQAVLPGCGVTITTNDSASARLFKDAENLLTKPFEAIKDKVASNEDPSDKDKPEVFVQIGHAGSVESVAFSPDGRWALSGSEDHTLRLWEVATGREVRTFAGHIGGVGAVAFSPDGKWILSGGTDGTLKLWDVATGRERRSFAGRTTGTGHAGAVWSVAFSPDGQSALSGSEDRTLRFWDVSTGVERRVLSGHAGPVRSVAFSPNGELALSGSDDGTLRIWNVAAERQLRTLSGHVGKVGAVAFSPDGKWALSGGTDKTLRLWDVTMGLERRVMIGHVGAVKSVTFSADGKWVLSGGEDGTLRLWDVLTGREMRSFVGRNQAVKSVAISPDGQLALSGSEDKTLRLWEVASGREVRSFTGGLNDMSSVDVSADGQWAISGDGDRSLRLWELSTGRLMRTFVGHGDGVFSVKFSPDGKWALSGGMDRTVRLWEVATGRQMRTFTGHAGIVFSVAFSPDGQWALSGSEDRTLRLWELATGRQMRIFTGHAGMVFSVAFSPDGQWALSGSEDKTLVLWNVETGRQGRAFTGHGGAVLSVAFSPNGKWALSGSMDRMLKLWEVSTGQEARTVVGPRIFGGHEMAVRSVAFSPNGKWALSGSADKTLRLWSVETGNEVRSFAGHAGAVRSVAFSPDGQLSISGGDDGSLRIWPIAEVSDFSQMRLWRAADEKELVKLVGFTDGEWVSITPKGYYTASDHGAQHLNVRIGNQLFGIESFFEQFYRPEVVATVLRTRELDAAVLAKLGEKERVNLAQAVKLPPSVKFLSPQPGESFDKDDVEVSVQATDQGGGVDEIRLFHNGKVVGAETRDLKVTAKGSTETRVTKSYRVRLVDGANVFRAVALSKDRIESNPDELTIQLKAVGKAATLHLLLVGINEYKNSALNLNYALPDAQGVQKFFTGAPSSLFKEVKRYELYDKAATKAAILAKLKELHASAPQDVVVIYLAGHGESLENTWYFIPHEMVTPEKDEQVKQQGLSSIELKEQVSQIGAQKVLVLIDACKSGSAMVAFAARGVEDRKAMAQLARSTGTHIVAASTKDQFAAEVKDLGHGVFTYTLLDGLSGKADSNPKDGTITVRELLTYVENRLPEVSEKYKQQAQYPVVDSRGQDFPLAMMR